MEVIKEKYIAIFEINFLLIISSIMGNHLIESMLIVLEFILIRATRQALHYDKAYKCIIMSTILMITNFLILKQDFFLAIITTFISAIILSETGNNKFRMKNLLTDGFMYKKSKYDEMQKYINDNEDSEEVKEFERRLKKHAQKTYFFYVLRIKKGIKFREIQELQNCDNRKITNELNHALEMFKIYFDT